MGIYLRPAGLEDAVAALAASRLSVLAGGTDFYPAEIGRRRAADILDVTAIPELRGIAETASEFRIGAATTWSQIIAAELPPWFRGLKLAAREVGGVQIQNAGTIAGNLCNASPAADGVPALLALGAILDLASAGGTRALPLAEFILGNRRTALRPDELVTAIRIPKPLHEARATFRKLGARKYLVISIAMVAAVIERASDGSIAAARIAVGACSAVAQRLHQLERDIVGLRLAPGIGTAVSAAHLGCLSPIDDVRGTAAYRIEAAREFVARALEDLAREDMAQ
jgi:CO/xanthine dehydrogenase FAD-binding subunit